MRAIVVALFIFASFGQFLSVKSQLAKAETIRLYQRYYASSQIDSILWTGSVADCDRGKLSARIQSKALERINFFRIACGLPRVEIRKDLCEMAQEAALLLTANGTITHFPNSNFRCYSDLGAEGCARAILSPINFVDYPATSFITGAIGDHGEPNYFAGHRRWLLFTKLAAIGYGATNKIGATVVEPRRSPQQDSLPEFIAYPWNGFVPVNLVFPLWSLSIPEGRNVDFSNCKVLVLDSEGVPIELQVQPIKEGFLDPTITWNMTGMFSKKEMRYKENSLEKRGFVGQVLSVIVSDVLVDGESQSFKYSVEIIRIPD